MVSHEMIFLPGLDQNVKVIAVAKLTGLSYDDVVGKLYRLWAWAVQNCECGRAPMTMDWIDVFLFHEGFASALVQTKLIEVDLTGWIAFGSDVCRSKRLCPGKASLRRAKTLAEKDAQSKVVPSIPAILNTPQFFDLWALWQTHRREQRKPVTNTTAAQQLKDMAKIGLERALACIEHSISMGWTGLFEPRGDLVRKTQASAQTEVAASEERRRQEILLRQQERKQRAQETIDRVRKERTGAAAHG